MFGRSTNVAALQADADVAAWVAAVLAAGGSVSATQQANVTTLVQALKGCGAWTLTDADALYAMEIQTQALVTLKRRVTQTLAHVTSTNPSFVASRGFLGNADGYVNTGWNPSAGSPQYAQNSARFGFWAYTLGTVLNYGAMGNDDANASEIMANPGAAYRYGINVQSISGASATMATGFVVAERTGANASAAYQNGTVDGTNTNASVAIPNANFFVLATNNGSGNPAHASDFGISAAFYGAPLMSAAMYVAEYAAFRAYMTAVGVP